LSGCRRQRASRRRPMKEVCSQGLADRVEFSCVTEHRPEAMSLTTCARSPAYRSGGVAEDPGPCLANTGAELLDCTTAWRAHSSGRHRSRSPESSHQVGLLDHLRYPATRSSRSPEDGGPRDVSRETGPRVWTHRLSSRTKSSGPEDPACRVTRVRRVRLPTAATGGGRRGRSTTGDPGYAECLGPTKGRAEVHTTMAWCR
jgi:hypothetical protein